MNIKKTRNFILPVIILIFLYTLIWTAIHGIPHTHVPKPEDISCITVTSENKEVKIENSNDIEILVNCINLTNHKLFGKAEGTPEISVNYHLKNGTMFTLSLNETSVWHNNSSYRLKEEGIAYNIIKILYLDKTE